MNTFTPSISCTTITEVVAAMKTVYDPEIGLNVVDLGLVYGIQIKDERVTISMTLTNPSCPLGQILEAGIRRVLCGLPGIKDCMIQLVWDPPWDPSMISEEGKRFLGQIC